MKTYRKFLLTALTLSILCIGQFACNCASDKAEPVVIVEPAKAPVVDLSRLIHASEFKLKDHRLPDVSSESLTGDNRTIRGVRIIRLWGSPYEQGYAHGYLSADEILFAINTCIVPAVTAYKPDANQLSNYQLTLRELLELHGMQRGIVDKLGADSALVFDSKTFQKRTVIFADLLAANTFGDWVSGACSSIIAWEQKDGKKTLIHARNLDYRIPRTVLENQAMIVRINNDGRTWINAGLPGMTGAYTAINDLGITGALHDSINESNSVTETCMPRASMLRSIMEDVAYDGKHPQATLDACEILFKSQVLRGGNIIPIAISNANIDDTDNSAFAAVFEIQNNGLGVIRRSPATSEDWIVATNHFLPEKHLNTTGLCDRYDMLRNLATKRIEYESPLNIDFAQDATFLTAADITTCRVMFDVNKKSIAIAFTSKKVHATEKKFTVLSWDELTVR